MFQHRLHLFSCTSVLLLDHYHHTLNQCKSKIRDSSTHHSWQLKRVPVLQCRKPRERLPNQGTRDWRTASTINNVHVLCSPGKVFSCSIAQVYDKDLWILFVGKVRKCKEILDLRFYIFINIR